LKINSIILRYHELTMKNRQHLPFARPSLMCRPMFVKAFGGVFEHSPWIADRAYRLLHGGTIDDAVSLHRALTGVFRNAGDDRRLAVLCAHPDLAGRLASAGRLTPESTAEQAGAGLDLLTDDEHALFTDLNDAYTRKYGFPFIIAVRDHDKAGILAAFRRRLASDRDAEFAEACREVERIAFLRLQDMLP
jgi:OHCU decarboxylase